MSLLNLFLILTPFAWGVACWFTVKGIAQDRNNWRTRTSFVALAIATVEGLSFLPVMMIVGHHPGMQNVRALDADAAAAVVVGGIALVVSFFGKPKLIVPIVLTCLGTASFWIAATIP
jgi:hypothetical protein